MPQMRYICTSKCGIYVPQSEAFEAYLLNKIEVHQNMYLIEAVVREKHDLKGHTSSFE